MDLPSNMAEFSREKFTKEEYVRRKFFVTRVNPGEFMGWSERERGEVLRSNKNILLVLCAQHIAERFMRSI